MDHARGHDFLHLDPSSHRLANERTDLIPQALAVPVLDQQRGETLERDVARRDFRQRSLLPRVGLGEVGRPVPRKEI